MMTFGDLVGLFLGFKQIKGLRPATLASYAEIAKRLADPGEPAIVLTPSRITERLHQARQEGLADASIWHIYGLAKRIGHFAMEQGLLQESPVVGVPQPRKPTKRRAAAKHDQLIKLLHTCSQSHWPARDLTILLLMGRSGLRVGELVKVRVTDVDLVGRWLHIPEEHSKTHTARDARLDIETRNALEQWLDVRPVVVTDTLLVSHSKRAAMSTNGIRQVLGNLCERAGIEPITPHQLRHLFATELADSGVNLSTLMSLAGWTDSRTALRYIHSSQKAIGQSFDRVRGIIETPAPKDQIGAVVAAIPSPMLPIAEELTDVLHQVQGNVSAAARLYDVGEAVMRAWVRDRGLVALVADLRKGQRERTQDGLSKAELAKLIVECEGRWVEVGKRIGATASGARQRAERLGLTSFVASLRSEADKSAEEQRRQALADKIRAAAGNLSEVARRQGVTCSSIWAQARQLGLLDLARQIRQAARA